MTHLTLTEQERHAYIAGRIQDAELLAANIELDEENDKLLDEVSEVQVFTGDLQEEMGRLRRFFDDCFSCLADHYPVPTVFSDYDQSVIFDAIRKGEGTTE